MNEKTLFLCYGGKASSVQNYPAPIHDQIVEPFAGGAGFSLAYHERGVWINDADRKIHAIWSFVINGPHHWLDVLPTDWKKGDHVLDRMPPGAPLGLMELLRAEANVRTQSSKGVRNIVTSFGVKRINTIRERVEYWIPRIAHWNITNLGYGEIPAIEATWFIDPPYYNLAGSKYRESHVDYRELAAWCRGRPGQVIVCENVGANWLPFRPSHIVNSIGGLKSPEAVWTNEPL